MYGDVVFVYSSRDRDVETPMPARRLGVGRLGVGRLGVINIPIS